MNLPKDDGPALDAAISREPLGHSLYWWGWRRELPFWCFVAVGVALGILAGWHG